MIHFIVGIIISFVLFFSGEPYAASYYEIGTPVLTEIWVDPVVGSDSNSGTEAGQALRTITEAWNRMPGDGAATTGYRINLLQGTYPCEPGPEPDNCVNYYSDRSGTQQYPIIIRAYHGPGTVTIRGGLDFNDVSYLYLIDLTLAGGMPLPVNISGNNLLHIADSDHILLRGLSLSGPSCANDTCNNLQEVLKVNQVQHLYVEGSTIGGAWHSSVDYMVVQYGHFLNNRVHTAGQWCMYAKGGSSYLHVEGNEFYGCQLGFSAGQAANFAVMRSPWLHYDAYDIKFINNVLHDIPGVGMSVAGGYNILLAHNTLYRVGISVSNGYGLMHFVRGERGCNPTDDVPDPVSKCAGLIGLGGWGPNFLTDSMEAIPNRNVYVYNNIFHNPIPSQTLYSHFQVYGPMAAPAGFMNVPSPSRTDENLVIMGNLIWNGPTDHPLGIEEPDQGCQSTNATCNIPLLNAGNAINTVEPQFVDPANGNFHPVTGGTVFTSNVQTIPDFTWNSAPASPVVPQGNLVNAVALDRDGVPRTAATVPGAFSTSSLYPLQNPCAAALSVTLGLQVPVINLYSQYYLLGLQYEQSAGPDILFRLTNAGGVSNANHFAGCQASTLSPYLGTFKMHVPEIQYQGATLWADFEYVPTSDGLVWFKLTNAGVK